MSEKKKGKQKKVTEEAPTKEEYAVAKYLRFGLPVREGKLHGMEVKCFIGSAAVDRLMESKWSSANNKKDPLFTNRVSCVSYMVELLQKGLFHRAEREKRKKDKDKEKPKKKKKEKEGEKEDAAKAEEEAKERKRKKEKKGKKDPETNVEETEKKESTEKKADKKDEKKKKEKRLKLVMPEEQFFEDGDEVYVWIYDPVNAKTFFIGLLMVLGAIGLCMFPLWPQEVRKGVYYISLSAAGFVGFILFLVVVRLVLFCFVWVLTMGKHHFWFLPNLTEDVGFFDSFKPLYTHDVVSRQEEKAKDTGKKKKKKKTEEEEEQKSVEDTEEKKEKSSDKDDSDEFEVIKKEDVSDQAGEDMEDENEDNDDNEKEDNGDDDEDDENIDEENGESDEEDEEEIENSEKKKTK